MKNRLETIAWIDSLLSMPMANVVEALNEYRNDLDRELPAPPAEVYVDVDAPVVEAPTIVFAHFKKKLYICTYKLAFNYV